MAVKTSDIDEVPAAHQDNETDSLKSDDEQATATFYMEPKQNKK
jgi:hypothetical protein